MPILQISFFEETWLGTLDPLISQEISFQISAEFIMQVNLPI